MSDPSSQPTQPLTDERLAAIRGRFKEVINDRKHKVHLLATDMYDLLNEVDRLRSERTLQAAKLDVIVAFVNEPTTPEREAGMGTARRLVNDLMGIKSEPNQWEQMTAAALGLDQDGSSTNNTKGGSNA